jgi:hypothetical protein
MHDSGFFAVVCQQLFSVITSQGGAKCVQTPDKPVETQSSAASLETKYAVD